MKRFPIILLSLASLLSAASGQETVEDLIISDFQITFKQTPVLEGDTVLLKASITNTSDQDFTAPRLTRPPITQSLRIYFYGGESRWNTYPLDASTNASTEISELAAHASFTFEGFWIAETGSHEQPILKLCDFYGNPLQDSAAQNLPEGFQVIRRYAKDLALTGIQVSESTGDINIREGAVLKIAAPVQNQGREQTSGQLGLYCDGTELQFRNVSLEAEEQDTVRFDYTARKGIHTLSLRLSSDENPSNDTLNHEILVFGTDEWVESFESGTFPPEGWQSDGSFYHDTYTGYHGSASVSLSTQHKFISPKLHITGNDTLHFALRINTSSKCRLLSSTDFRHWEEVATYGPGNNTFEIYALDFSLPEYASLQGERYFAFEQSEGFGSYLDLVYGPQPVLVEDDFSLLDTRSGFMQENRKASFGLHVQNNGLQTQSKVIFLLHEEDTLARGNTGEIGAGENRWVPLEWTPDFDTTDLALTLLLEGDDADADNFQTFTALVYPAIGETLPMEEGFESSDALEDSAYAWWQLHKGKTGFPVYWDITNQNKLSDARIYEGKNVLFLYRNGQADTTDLVSPLYTLPHEKYTLSFHVYRTESASENDQVSVYFNTEPSRQGAIIIGNFSQNIHCEPAVTEPGWYPYVFEMDTREFSQGFFILSGISSSTYERTYLDLLSISGSSSHDAAIIAMSPADSSRIWGHRQARQDVSIKIRNEGGFPLESARIEWSVDGARQENVEWTGFLPAGDSTDILLEEGLLLETGRMHRIQAKLIAPYDTSYTDNNTYQVNIDVPQALLAPYTNGFETDSSLDYWTFVDKDGDAFNWQKESSTPHGGRTSMASYSFFFLENGQDTVLTPDNWLITPAIQVEYDSLHLSFHVGAGAPDAFAETYEILVSCHGTDTAHFVPLHKETLEDASYHETVLDLTRYKDSLIFIAFRHFESTNSYFLSIDDISLSYPEKPEPETYTLVLTAVPEEGGTVNGGGEFEARTEVTVTATANEGFEFVKWQAGEDSLGNQASYTFSLDADTELTAYFREIQQEGTFFMIIASHEGEGTILPSDTTYAEEGETVSYSIKAADNWIISDVVVDDNRMGPLEQYTFESLSSNHRIHAIFVPEAGTEAANMAGIRVYPNPTQGKVNIQMGDTEMEIKLFHPNGQLLQNFPENAGSLEIDLSGYASGVYILQVGKQVMKILKQ